MEQGFNYYVHNQWVDGDLRNGGRSRLLPLSQLLADVHARYCRPMFLGESGIEGDVRPAWFRVIGHEVTQARQAGRYEYPGWDDERNCLVLLRPTARTGREASYFR